ncbi:MAG: Uma2 family endonuclease [Pyrinomonadaceae bacterium]|nr:Uma2 family endonuclease [Pyrinomonadaceae bacterium]
MSEKNLSQTDKNYSVEEYQKLERRSASKNEFFDGKVLAKSASNRANNLIATNITIAVGSRLQGQKCEIYVNDMRVQLNAKHISYPDVVIVSGVPSFSDNGYDTLLNPTAVFEIFSKNTSFQDKTEKLECYLAMGSVREYLLVKEDETRVEHYFKQNPKQWIYRIYDTREDVISIESINCKISLSEIYAQVKFGQTEMKSQSVN